MFWGVFYRWQAGQQFLRYQFEANVVVLVRHHFDKEQRSGKTRRGQNDDFTVKEIGGHESLECVFGFDLKVWNLCH